MKPQYSTIGKTLSLRASIDQLSGRDKVNLFQDLMENLGITRRMHEEPDATARAQEIITEQWNKAWEEE